MGFNQWRPVRPRRYSFPTPPAHKVAQEPQPTPMVEAPTPPKEEPTSRVEIPTPAAPEIETATHTSAVEKKFHFDFRWVKPSLRAIIFSAVWFICILVFLAYLYLSYLSSINAI